MPTAHMIYTLNNNETRTVSITQPTKRELRRSIEEVYERYRENNSKNILFMKEEFRQIMYSDIVGVFINYTD
jgi:flagellar biosynthesis component FlhA